MIRPACMRKGEVLETSLNSGCNRVSGATVKIGRLHAAGHDEVAVIQHEAEMTVGVPVQATRPDRLLTPTDDIAWVGIVQVAVEVDHAVVANNFKSAPLVESRVELFRRLDARGTKRAFLIVVYAWVAEDRVSCGAVPALKTSRLQASARALNANMIVLTLDDQALPANAQFRTGGPDLCGIADRARSSEVSFTDVKLGTLTKRRGARA